VPAILILKLACFAAFFSITPVDYGPRLLSLPVLGTTDWTAGVLYIGAGASLTQLSRSSPTAPKWKINSSSWESSVRMPLSWLLTTSSPGCVSVPPGTKLFDFSARPAAPARRCWPSSFMDWGSLLHCQTLTGAGSYLWTGSLNGWSCRFGRLGYLLRRPVDLGDAEADEVGVPLNKF